MTLAISGSPSDQEYTIGDGNTVLSPPSYTQSDTYCDNPVYTVINVVDPGVTENTLPSSAAADSFYHTDTASPDINVDFVTNSHFGAYTIRVEALTSYASESFEFVLTLTPKCSLDSINIPVTPTYPYGPLAYTIHSAATTTSLTPFETDYPDACPIEYRLLDSSDTEISQSSIAGMVTFTFAADPISLEIGLFYDTDNEFGGQTYTLKLEGRFVSDNTVTTVQSISLTTTKDCTVAALTVPSLSDLAYTIGQGDTELTIPPIEGADQYCNDPTYTISEVDYSGPTETAIATAASGLTDGFYHLDNTSPNVNAIFGNNDLSGNRYLKLVVENEYTQHQYSLDNTYELTYEVTVILTKDCSIETITVPGQILVSGLTSLSYTIVDESFSETFTAFTTTRPTSCPMQYRLLDGNDDEISGIDLGNMVTFVEASL